jgi:hypothetical protein
MTHAHLNGSLNLASADESLAMVGSLLGDRLSRVPDGETTRRYWANSLIPLLYDVPQLERVDDGTYEPDVGYSFPTFVLRSECQPEDVDFGVVEFADTALAGYRSFDRARGDGLLPASTRFQVSLPTPTPVEFFFFHPDLHGQIWERFAEHQRREITRLLEQVPAADIAVQWDVAPEMAFAAGTVASLPSVPLAEVVARLGQLASFVPAEAELGFHLCYGDPRPDMDPPGMQVIVPDDIAFAVTVMNAIDAAAERQVDWYSVPAPAGQAEDEDYFRPLRDLTTGAGTQIQLGLVDDTDGLPGSLRRAELARAHLADVRADFGVATVCGMGRRHTAAIPGLLQLHRDLVDTLG